MDVSVLVWGISIAVVLGLFVFDFFSHVRTPHEPSLKESGFWSAVYIGLAIIFGIGVWAVSGSRYGGEFFAGFVTEKALSVVSLFVFVIIMAKFAVPRIYQQKVLLIGIVMALVLRGIFIAAGAAVISAYSWVFYLFGAFLIYTAIKLVKESVSEGGMVEEEEKREGRVATIFKRFVPTTDKYDGDKLFTRENGRRVATPLLLALVVIGFTDILFAFDSIPAIYGLTQEPYLVFMANAFALMGLRQLFFLIGGLLDRLVYLSYGLSIILGFIGVKLVLHALHYNTFPWINGGEEMLSVPTVSTGVSLSFIISVLVITTVASLVKSRSDRKNAGSGDADKTVVTDQGFDDTTDVNR